MHPNPIGDIEVRTDQFEVRFSGSDPNVLEYRKGTTATRNSPLSDRYSFGKSVTLASKFHHILLFFGLRLPPNNYG